MRTLVGFRANTHFALRGCQITWPEIVGVGTFDLLVEDESSESLEVECKSIGEDIDRAISGCQRTGSFSGLSNSLFL
jgi:hypothetical protein